MWMSYVYGDVEEGMRNGMVCRWMVSDALVVGKKREKRRFRN
jgi:hypothetical protein